MGRERTSSGKARRQKQPDVAETDKGETVKTDGTDKYMQRIKTRWQNSAIKPLNHKCGTPWIERPRKRWRQVEGKWETIQNGEKRWKERRREGELEKGFR